MQSIDDASAGSCAFCAIVAGTAPAHLIYEDRLVIGFMDILPATRGHALLVPRAHRRDLFDADGDELAALMAGAQQVARAARDSLGADGVNLVHATGEAAFQTEFHLHLHVVLRYAGDSVIVFPRPGLPQEIAAAASHLRRHLLPGVTLPAEV